MCRVSSWAGELTPDAVYVYSLACLYTDNLFPRPPIIRRLPVAIVAKKFGGGPPHPHMADGSYSDTGEPTQLRPRHVIYENDPSLAQSTAVWPSTDPVPISRTQHRASPTASVPAYSDGFPYPEPKVSRRPVSTAIGWITSNSWRDDWRTRGKEKAKTLPFEKDQKPEGLLSRLFGRNWSENALQVHGSSSRTLGSVPSSVSSSVTRSGATFSNAAGSLTSSSSSICDGDGHSSPTRRMQRHSDVPSAPCAVHQLHGGSALGSVKRSCSEVDLVTEPDLFIEFSKDMHLSRYGSCRDMAQEDNNDSGLASDPDANLLQPHLPDTALDVGPRKDEASLPSEGVALPGEQVVKVVTQSCCSSGNLTQQASQDDSSSSPAREEVQRHTSDPTHASEVSLYSQRRHKAQTSQQVIKGASRPLSLCAPVEWSAFGDSRSTENLIADTSDPLLKLSGKGRLVAAVSTMDIRTPPTSMKVVRASASYVDVHLISKIDTADVSCAVDFLQWCRLYHWNSMLVYVCGGAVG